MNRVLVAGLGAAALAVSSGCSESTVALIIQPFEQTGVEIQVGQPFNLKVRLSRNVDEKTHVDLDQTHADFLEMPEELVYKAGENLKVAELVGKASTPDPSGYLSLTFTIRGLDKSREWHYRVKSQSAPGPRPDHGAAPPPPDSGPAPDVALDAAADAPSPDVQPDTPEAGQGT